MLPGEAWEKQRGRVCGSDERALRRIESKREGPAVGRVHGGDRIPQEVGD